MRVISFKLGTRDRFLSKVSKHSILDLRKMTTLSPAESGEFIVKNAKFLKVNEDGIRSLVKEVIDGIQTKEINVENFSQHEYHPKPTDPHAANWIFLIDTLNFCFWTPGNATKWKVNGQTGYFSLCAAINRALANGVDITNPSFYSKITLEQLEQILRSDDGETQPLLMPERVACLHEVGKVLLDKYDGKFDKCVEACNNSAVTLLKLVTDEFPCFRDEAMYDGKRVSIYKRAQILVGDLWACYRGEGLGRFDDIEKMTMFADYRVPQVLVHFGTLTYSDELMDLLKSDKILDNGCSEEVEIRGASIYVVERLKELVLAELKANHPDISPKNVNAVLLDHFLWDYRRKHAVELEYIPFHKTISVYY
ncbi:queuosine salvage protein [Toxorhynchites rutilus septentrionalis]|uniref:queuosine salvage protein n=1 Tax=Toxorhynchites rutilus septentrionalis TaxID=329112 RepID=UPI00247B25E7|nr:queuosine salvage protein [Toxorhynchites rutilus septentrionalis]